MSSLLSMLEDAGWTGVTADVSLLHRNSAEETIELCVQEGYPGSQLPRPSWVELILAKYAAKQSVRSL